MASATSSDNPAAPATSTESADEIARVKATYPSRCRVMCDVGEYKKVITLQPENLDATVKFHLTAAYPSVIPDIKVRSESLSGDDIQQLQRHLKETAQELMGKEMIQTLMNEAQKRLKALGIRPGKVKNANAETYLDEKSNKYKKKKNKQKKSKAKEEEDEGDQKLPPMKTADDVVKRIIWDDNLDSDHFLVGYIDRFRGLLEKYFMAFSWEDIATVDYDVLAIPKHRIQYFKYKDVKVWDKTKRLDNVFGSANGKKTIDVVMKEVDEQEQQQRQQNQNGAMASAARSSSDSDFDSSDDDSDDDDFTVTISSSVNIGVNNSNQQKATAAAVHEQRGEYEGQFMRHQSRASDSYWTDKLRPNYFICVRVTDKSVIDGIVKVQDKILQHEPILAECCIPGVSLHVTITCIGLDTAEQLLKCMEALKKMKPELKDALPTSSLKLKGVSNFYGRVAYAKVHYEKDFLDFCDYLKLSLREAGVDIRDGYEFVPHSTIIKVTRPVARVRGTKNINPKFYEDFVDTDFGEQTVDSVYLCSMGNERRPDGFYLTPLELHFDE